MNLLERKFAMYILLALQKHPMSTKTDIMRLDPGFEKTKYLRIQELTDAGFIEYRKDPEINNWAKMVLTPSGEDLADKIKKARRILLRPSEGNISDEDDV